MIVVQSSQDLRVVEHNRWCRPACLGRDGDRNDQFAAAGFACLLMLANSNVRASCAPVGIVERG
jgi:hypothetical protein